MRKPILLVALALIVALALGVTGAIAKGTYARAFDAAYPGSQSENNVEDGCGKVCQLCHSDVGGGDGWNGYGWDLKLRVDAGESIESALANVESSDSDGNGDANIAEINADSQPGWTGGDNTAYFKDGSVSTMPAPGCVLGSLDPGAPPTATTTTTEPTTTTTTSTTTTTTTEPTTTTTTSTTTTTAPTTTSTTIPPTTTTTEPTTTSTTQPGLVDLDISSFRVSKRVSLSSRKRNTVNIKLGVENPNTSNDERLATVQGLQNQVEAYNETLLVSDKNGKSVFRFPEYLPAVEGTISWTATIADDDPDQDVAAAQTQVKP